MDVVCIPKVSRKNIHTLLKTCRNVQPILQNTRLQMKALLDKWVSIAVIPMEYTKLHFVWNN